MAVVGLLSGAAHAQEGGQVEPFDDPALPGWDRSPNAIVGDGVLRIRGEGYAMRPEAQVSGGLILRLRFEGDGFLEVRYRITDAGMYILRLNPEEVLLVRETGGRQVTLASAPSSLVVGQWWLLEMSFAGIEQRVFVGPGVELHAVDDDPLKGAGLMLHVFGEAVAEFDDLTLVPGEGGGVSDAPSEPLPTAEPQRIGDLTWIRTGGPPGGLGYDIRYNFDDPNNWYATDNFGGVHVSLDDGLTWSPSNSGIPRQSGSTGDALPVFCLTVDPLDPQIVWVGTDITGHIYKSTDGGRSWVEKDSGVTLDYDTLTFRGFTVDPRSSDIVYAMGETTQYLPAGSPPAPNVGGVIYRTTDGGESWHKIWDGGMPSSLTRYLWINPQDPDILFASTGIFDRAAVGAAVDWETNPDPFGGLGVLKSTDGGATWRILNEANGLKLLYIGSLFMHPEDPAVLLAAAGVGMPEAAIQRLIAEGHSPAGVYRTSDAGETWTQVLEPAPDRIGEAFSSVELCPSDPNIGYAGSELAVYRTQDAGLTWDLVAGSPAGWGPPGVRSGWPIDMQCDPRDTNRVFANNYSGGNFLTEDGGRTWINASLGYTGAQVINLAVDPADAAHLFSVGRNGPWESTDGGGTWQPLQDLPAEMPLAGGEWGGAAFDPVNPDHVLLGTERLLESTDDGWQVQIMPFAFGPMASAIVFAPSDALVVYVASAEHNCMVHHTACPPTTGLAVSHDGGKTWQDISAGPLLGQGVTDLAVDPFDPSTVYAAADDGLYRSSDAGASWRRLGGLPEGQARMVAVSPADSATLLTSLHELGFYISRDTGAAWEQVTAGLEANGSHHKAVFDPTDAQVIYTTDTFSGVYRSADGGRTWAQINDGLDMRAVTGLAISSDGQHVYVGTNGAGVHRLDLNGQPPVAMTQPKPGATGLPATAAPAIAPTTVPTPIATEAETPGIAIYLGLGASVVILGVLALFLARRRHA
jgi:photosystem II stability/assembly factor-like uncharacterized protein